MNIGTCKMDPIESEEKIPFLHKTWHFFQIPCLIQRILIMLGGKPFPWPRTIQTAMYCSSQFLLENTSTPQLLPLPEFFQFKLHLDPPPGCNRHRQDDMTSFGLANPKLNLHFAIVTGWGVDPKSLLVLLSHFKFSTKQRYSFHFLQVPKNPFLQKKNRPHLDC